MMLIQTFEKIISKTYQDRIDNIINNDMFPWYFLDSILTQKEYNYDYRKDIPTWNKNEVVDSFGLIHLAGVDNEANSPYFEMFLPVLYFVEEKAGVEIDQILRVRIRRTMKTPNTNENTYNTPHVDLIHDKPFLTFVYYVEESDGHTILFDKIYQKDSFDSQKEPPKIMKKVPHIKGNGVLFDGYLFHAGNSPQNYMKRTVINFDFTIKEKL